MSGQELIELLEEIRTLAQGGPSFTVDQPEESMLDAVFAHIEGEANRASDIVVIADEDDDLS